MHIRSMSKVPSKASFSPVIASIQEIVSLLDSLFKATIDGNSAVNAIKANF